MRYRVEVADRACALYALWNGRIFRAQRSTADASVLLTPLPGEDPPDEFDTEVDGTRGKVVPAAEANATFAIHTYCYYDDEPYLIEPRSTEGELILRWAGTDEQRARELGLTGFTTTVRDPESLTALWQERHDFVEDGAPRTEPGNGDTRALLRAIGRTLRGSLPSGWHRVSAQFRQVGDYSELEVRAVAVDTENPEDPEAPGATVVSLSAPPQLGQLFAQLRSAMYEPDAGTWFQGTFTLDQAHRFDFDYDSETEPEWRLPPSGRRTARSYEAELGYYPRKRLPIWLAAHAGLPADVVFRHAQVVDGYAEGEKPVVNRSPVPQDEVPRVLAYLYRAPIALSRPGALPDIFVGGSPPGVPDAFHTDGVWIWPAAVPHYLRTYGVPPEPELLDHIRTHDYRVPYVARVVRASAEADLLGRPRPARTAADLGEPDPVTRVHRGAEPKALRASEVLEVLRTRLGEYGVADSAYRIGEPADGAWCLRRTADGWEVARYEGGRPVEPRYFPRVQPAAEALLGALLLMPGRMRAGSANAAEEPQDTRHTSAEDQAHATDWPILPMRGEPPLPYYRNKRLVTLPAGTTVQRYGNENGNLVHPEGTPFPHTSLAFEREADVRGYVVRRPLRVLTGVTAPWGPLPGGAVGYLLPHAIGHHVESGALERIG